MSNAPKVTPADLEAIIAYEYYQTGSNMFLHCTPVMGPAYATQHWPLKALDCLTFCVLVLKNGYTVTGESACVSPENFDEAIGRAVARENAINKLWPLLGYQLKEELCRDKNSH